MPKYIELELDAWELDYLLDLVEQDLLLDDAPDEAVTVQGMLLEALSVLGVK